MELKRIYLPKPNKNNEYVSYEKQLQPRYVFDTEERRDFFHAREDEIMEIVVKEITEYVNCEDACNDSDNMFPQPKFMTGEWYLRDVNFEEDSFLSIQVAFLGTDLGYPDDYLGLEVVFEYDAESDRFIVDGVNSSSI